MLNEMQIMENSMSEDDIMINLILYHSTKTNIKQFEVSHENFQKMSNEVMLLNNQIESFAKNHNDKNNEQSSK